MLDKMGGERRGEESHASIDLAVGDTHHLLEGEPFPHKQYRNCSIFYSILKQENIE